MFHLFFLHFLNLGRFITPNKKPPTTATHPVLEAAVAPGASEPPFRQPGAARGAQHGALSTAGGRHPTLSEPKVRHEKDPDR